jgi:hypothetical protein
MPTSHPSPIPDQLFLYVETLDEQLLNQFDAELAVHLRCDNWEEGSLIQRAALVAYQAVRQELVRRGRTPLRP